MTYTKEKLGLALVAASAMFGCAADMGSQDDLDAAEQDLLATENGLRTINGLSTKNGLRTINGLSTKNGLRTVNGLTTMNGLRTINGLRTVNGLNVDCSDATLGVSCTGAPDGLLSNKTGLMSTVDGETLARYLVRCALPGDDSISILDHTGALMTLHGEMGLAPEWADGQCSGDCEEKVSACLMSLTNVLGNHVAVELSNQGVLGAGHTSDYPYQEAVFYGNVFTSPPSLNFAIGKDYQGLNIAGIAINAVANRICLVTNLVFGSDSCPYQPAGNANFDLTDPFGFTSNKCSMSGGAASSCRDKSGKKWLNPITTYRKDKGAT